MITCLEIGLENNIDFILFQEPYILHGNTISHPAYNVILPLNHIRPRVAIFHSKKSVFNYNLIYNSCDLQIINILIDNKNIQLINIYNEKERDKNKDKELENSLYTIERELIKIKPEKNAIIAGDFNAHHPWWNKNINNSIRADNLIQWLKKYKFELLNTPDIPTWHRKNSNSSVLDLIFYSHNMNNNNNFFSWNIDLGISSGSDHEILFYSYKNINNTALNPIADLPYNFEKANQKVFSENINKFNKQYSFINLDWDSEIELKKQAEILQDIIIKAADLSIPKKGYTLNPKHGGIIIQQY